MATRREIMPRSVGCRFSLRSDQYCFIAFALEEGDLPGPGFRLLVQILDSGAYRARPVVRLGSPSLGLSADQLES